MSNTISPTPFVISSEEELLRIFGQNTIAHEFSQEALRAFMMSDSEYQPLYVTRVNEKKIRRMESKRPKTGEISDRILEDAKNGK